MEILNGVFDIGPVELGGPISKLHLYTFPRPVRQASVILTGFTAEFPAATVVRLVRDYRPRPSAPRPTRLSPRWSR